MQFLLFAFLSRQFVLQNQALDFKDAEFQKQPFTAGFASTTVRTEALAF